MSAAKKEKSQPTLAGALIAGAISAALGVVVAFCVLAGTAPATYTPTPKKAGDPPPPPPAGVWYWAGTQSGGDWHGKETVFIAAGSGQVPLQDAELNIWAGTIFKAAPPAAAAGKPGAPAETATFKTVAGAPNFRSWHGKDAPEGYFQIAMPFAVSVMGYDFSVLYQVRGTFANGAKGPEFEPEYTSFGQARLPAAIGKWVFDKLVADYTPGDAVKKYAGAWAKYNSAQPQDGQLVLARP